MNNANKYERINNYIQANADKKTAMKILKEGLKSNKRRNSALREQMEKMNAQIKSQGGNQESKVQAKFASIKEKQHSKEKEIKKSLDELVKLQMI